MNAIKNITVGHTERLRKPVGYTMLANLVNIVSFYRSHKCDFPYV
jgi:ATP-binding cassette subfamily B protein IrtB